MKFFQKLQLLKSKNSQLTLDILTNIVVYVMVVLFYLSGITLILMITSPRYHHQLTYHKRSLLWACKYCFGEAGSKFGFRLCTAYLWEGNRQS